MLPLLSGSLIWGSDQASLGDSLAPIHLLPPRHEAPLQRPAGHPRPPGEHRVLSDRVLLGLLHLLSKQVGERTAAAAAPKAPPFPA